MKYFCHRLLAGFSLIIGFINASQEGVQVLAPVGPIKGSFMTTRLGRQIYSFRGIRYAEPPVGENRFQPPIPVKPWSEVFDASEEGPSCVRPKIPSSSEDCLRLNVYTTKLPSSTNTKGRRMQNVQRPVIVFFHPGGFYGYSAQSNEFGPQYLLDKDVVLVTVNYRLATLGFISTGDALAPGNLGLKDQVAALRWVQQNIAAFGGDPNCVTITGDSAGSWSAVLHLLSPMSAGLFHRVIAQSGAPTKQESLPNHQRQLVTRQAQFLGCPTADLAESINCLKTKPAEAFANSLQSFFEFYGDPVLVWSPVVEPEIPGVERFLPGKPEDLIREGKFHKVPIITGVTKDEFGGVVVYPIAAAQEGNYSIFDEYNSEWYRIAPISFMYERNTPHSREISDKLKKFYFNNKPVSLDNIENLAHLYADALIGFEVHRFVNLISAVSPKPVYYYKFSFQGRYSYAYYINTTQPYGVEHQDDLMYVYLMKNFPLFKNDDPEIVALEKMTAIFEHFARTGEPIPKNNPLFQDVVWNRFTPKDKGYLDIGNHTLTMKTGLNQDRMDFWDDLFPLQPLPT